MDSTKRFSSRVGYYVKARPRYPAGLLRFFQSDLGLSPLHAVADIGSGTGFLTELFVRNGNPTFAVEPNAEMRLAGETHLGQWANFHSINGTAEATTLADASVSLIAAGQAAHWFDIQAADREFRRILQPGGHVALVWNERLNGGSKFMQGYEALINDFSGVGDTPRHRNEAAGVEPSVAWLAKAEGYGVRSFDNPQVLDREGMIDRLVSSSYMPLPGDPRHDAMIARALELFDAFAENGTVRVLHETKVYFGQFNG